MCLSVSRDILSAKGGRLLHPDDVCTPVTAIDG